LALRTWFFLDEEDGECGMDENNICVGSGLIQIQNVSLQDKKEKSKLGRVLCGHLGI
jgi:hypothetical protein